MIDDVLLTGPIAAKETLSLPNKIWLVMKSYLFQIF